MKTTRTSSLSLFPILAAAGALFALGAMADAGHSHGGSSIGEPAKTSDGARTVRMKLGDSFFEPRTIRIEPGETVRFVLSNSGELLHEFNIATAAMHAEHRKEMQAMADAGLLTATGLQTHGSGSGRHVAMKHDDPNSVLVGPGETKELVWNFPKRTELQFACNLPGHFEAGMVGDFEFSR